MIGTGTTNYRKTDMPEFTGKKAFVLGGAFSGSIRALMLEGGFEAAKSLIDADVVVFSGGEDVDPALYGEAPHRTTYFTKSRDDYERQVYDVCVKDKKFMFGICRGAQFLHVMNGGRLWQNVEGHGGRSHMIVDLDEDVRVEATSIHHQMLRDNNRIVVVALCEDQISRVFEAENTDIRLRPDGMEKEIEAGLYPDTGCFFVQGHPEVGTPEYRSWTMHKLKDCLDDWEATNGPMPVEIDYSSVIKEII